MDFDAFIKPIIDLPIAHAWRGQYSTIFLELGKLRAGRTRRDGSVGNARGEFTVHLEPNWRIEGQRSIICGSNDSARALDKALARLIDDRIVAISTVGSLPELEITAKTLSLRTFAASKGQPNWTVNRWSAPLAMYCRLGKIAFDGEHT